MTAADIIRKLALKPHPEGGHYRETFRDPRTHRRPRRLDRDLVPAGARRALALAPRRCGRDLALLRRRPLKLEVVDGAKEEIVTARRRHPRRRGAAGRSCRRAPGRRRKRFGDWTLVGCTVAPGFDFNGFELAPPGWRRHSWRPDVRDVFSCRRPHSCRSAASSHWRQRRRRQPPSAPPPDISACWRHWLPSRPGA